MFEDYVAIGGAVITTFAVIILGVYLGRYRKLVAQSDESSRLAKDVWDSVSSRFQVVDTRIIDLMARVEVLSTKEQGVTAKKLVSSQPPRSAAAAQQQQQLNAQREDATRTTVVTPTGATTTTPVPTLPAGQEETRETERTILQLLASGPKTAVEIKDLIHKSREHTGRLMKMLFDRGLVLRNDQNKPYVYELTQAGRTYLGS